MIFLLAFSLWASAQEPSFSETRILRTMDIHAGTGATEQFVILDDQSLWVRRPPTFGRPVKDLEPKVIPTPGFYSREFLVFEGRLFIIVQTLFDSEKMIAEIQSSWKSKMGPKEYGKGLPYFLATTFALSMSIGNVVQGKMAGAVVTTALAVALILKGAYECRRKPCSEMTPKAELLLAPNGLPYRILNIQYNSRDYAPTDIKMAPRSGPSVMLSEHLRMEECASFLDSMATPPVAPD